MRAAVFNRLEGASGLDRVGDRIQQIVQSVLRPKVVRDALHGVWLEPSAAPRLVQVPVGAWMSAAVLDLLPGQQRAATTLIGVGVASAVPSAVAGLNDWAVLSREERRVGLVHATGNTIALLLYSMSLSARLRGDHARGRLLAWLGLSAASASAYIGGHLAYHQGAQVQPVRARDAPDPGRLAPGRRGRATAPGAMVGSRIGDVPILVYRDNENVSVCSTGAGTRPGR